MFTLPRLRPSALLEILVHLETDEDDRPDSYQILKVEAADDIPWRLSLSSLPPDWKSNEEPHAKLATRGWRNRQARYCGFHRSSSPETYNWLLNPRHADAQEGHYPACGKASLRYSTLRGKANRSARSSGCTGGSFVESLASPRGPLGYGVGSLANAWPPEVTSRSTFALLRIGLLANLLKHPQCRWPPFHADGASDTPPLKRCLNAAVLISEATISGYFCQDRIHSEGRVPWPVPDRRLRCSSL